MTVIRKRKIMMIMLMLTFLSIAVLLIMYALRQNISLFYSPTQALSGEAPLEHLIRIGGMVKKGSIVRESQGLNVRFEVTDLKHTVTIHYSGILPDLFREGQGIVAEGKLNGLHQFNASQILAKHDANYMPPEVKAALAKEPAI